MDANEEYVRSRWENLRAEPYANAPSHLCIRVGGSRFVNSIAGSSEAWQAAADFTHERERQIAEVKEEIALIRNSYQTCFNIGKGREFKDETRTKMAAEALAWQRVLDAREQALAELSRGMKEPQQ